MKSYLDYILEARNKNIALGHFNVSTIDGIWAVVDAAKSLNVPVIIGVSEGERDFIGVSEIASIVKSIRENRKQPVFLNADHTYSFERVKEAVVAGFDSVIFDGAGLSLEDNIKETKRCVDFAESYRSGSGEKILVEGEIGFIGKSSKILDEIPEGVVVGDDMMTKPEDAKRFVLETGIDLLAPAVGNIHGMIRGGDPKLNIDRIKELSQAVSVPLVLHGASGNTIQDLGNSIKSGTAIVHINTELRIAYRAGLLQSLSSDRDEISPYKYLKPAKLAMQKIVEEKLKIFSAIS